MRLEPRAWSQMWNMEKRAEALRTILVLVDRVQVQASRPLFPWRSAAEASWAITSFAFILNTGDEHCYGIGTTSSFSARCSGTS